MPEKKKTNPTREQQGIDSPSFFKKFGKKNPKGKKSKPKKAPPGTKIGPGRKEKKANPHGVDDGTIYLKDGGSVSEFPDLSGDGKVTQKDILMGRGVVKKANGGQINGLKKMGMKVGGLAGRLAQRGYGKARR